MGVIWTGQIPEALREGLRDLGYVEGQNLILEHRDSEGQADPLAEQAAELVVLSVDLIVTAGTLHAAAAKAATNALPIVHTGGGADLVAMGLVESLAHPGGNLTGITIGSGALEGKRLQLLTEIVPRIARVAVLWDPNVVQAFPHELFERHLRALGLQLVVVEARGPDDLESAFEAAGREGADAVNVISTVLANAHRQRVIAVAAQHRLPAMYPTAAFVRDGGLMAYQGRTAAMQRRAAYYVDPILQGAKPADLPVEQPTTFDFVINLKTAQTLGLSIPQHVFLQATEVIQ